MDNKLLKHVKCQIVLDFNEIAFIHLGQLNIIESLTKTYSIYYNYNSDIGTSMYIISVKT